MNTKKLAEKLSKKIKEICPENGVKAIHVCGTHEQSITKHGLRSMFPETFDLKMGPGCPVCVTPAKEIDEAIWLAENGVTIATFGDMINVPGTNKSLSDVKAENGDVRIVYSVNEAIEISKKVDDLVFFGIGFETTAPLNAVTVKSDVPKNFSLLTSHRLIPPAMEALINLSEVSFDGFMAPGHVSTIIGIEPYKPFSKNYGFPTIITGFEPIDILYGSLKLLKQIKNEESKVENAYKRVVEDSGNVKARNIMYDVFRVCDAKWRGIGEIPNSGLKLKDEYENINARSKFDINVKNSRDIHPNCKCHLILTARASPSDCPLFGEECKPNDPRGPCMVSKEGECNVWYKYGGTSEI